MPGLGDPSPAVGQSPGTALTVVLSLSFLTPSIICCAQAKAFVFPPCLVPASPMCKGQPEVPGSGKSASQVVNCAECLPPTTIFFWP